MTKKGNRRKSRKLLKVFMGVIAVVAVSAAGLAYWQRDNITAVVKSQTSSKEDIAEEIAQSKAKTQKAIEEYKVPIKRDFTLEEEEEIRKGTLSVEDAVKRIMSDNSTASTADSTQTSANGAAADTQNKNENNGSTSGSTAAESKGEELTPEQQIVAKYLTEMYSLKAYYIGQLGVLEQQLKSQYKAQNGSDRSASSIASFVSSNMNTAVTLESECDTKVEGILGNMRSELEAIGADTSIVDIAEDSYVNEKSLRKSYYLSLYK